jgi:hypothetical protein
MSEWHDYSENNISFCQICKDLYEANKDEDGQIEDYHMIEPLSKGKKRSITASLADFAKGAKLRLNKKYKGNSQLGAFDLDSDSDDDKKTTTSSPKTSSSPKKKRGVTATLKDFANGAKLRLNKDYKGNSQLGAFDLDSDSDDDKKTTSSPKVTSTPKTQKNTLSKGGRRRRTHSKKKRSPTKKRTSHSKKRRSHKK